MPRSVREVQLGEHKYAVFAQRIGYLLNKLGPRTQEILETETEGIDGALIVGEKAHGLLKVFIPELMPLHEFLGYASHEAMLAKDYDEVADKSPEPMQIKAAFKAASEVNGGEVFSHLKALLGPVLTQRVVALLTARMAENMPTSTTSDPSPTSPPTSGESDPTSSGTTAPTSTPSEG